MLDRTERQALFQLKKITNDLLYQLLPLAWFCGQCRLYDEVHDITSIFSERNTTLCSVPAGTTNASPDLINTLRRSYDFALTSFNS
jgi:hypothetical protein